MSEELVLIQEFVDSVAWVNTEPLKPDSGFLVASLPLAKVIALFQISTCTDGASKSLVATRVGTIACINLPGSDSGSHAASSRFVLPSGISADGSNNSSIWICDTIADCVYRVCINFEAGAAAVARDDRDGTVALVHDAAVVTSLSQLPSRVTVARDNKLVAVCSSAGVVQLFPYGRSSACTVVTGSAHFGVIPSVFACPVGISLTAYTFEENGTVLSMPALLVLGDSGVLSCVVAVHEPVTRSPWVVLTDDVVVQLEPGTRLHDVMTSATYDPTHVFLDQFNAVAVHNITQLRCLLSEASKQLPVFAHCLLRFKRVTV